MADNDGGAADLTVLLTRPESAARAFGRQVTARLPGARLVISPLMEIVRIGAEPMLPPGSDAIFTSTNGVAMAGDGHGRRAWCVGARTTEAARHAGYDARKAGDTASELIAALVANGPSRPLLHFRGRHQRGDIVQTLRAAGFDAAETVVYDQIARAPDTHFREALAMRPLLVPLFSPRSAALFAAAAGEALGPGPGPSVRFLALSDAVRAALPVKWQETTTCAARPDAPAMLDLIETCILP